MKVTVCELPDESGQLETAWDGLTTHLRSSGSQLVLLPEMPFHPWLAATDKVNEADWQAAVEAQRGRQWIRVGWHRLGDLPRRRGPGHDIGRPALLDAGA